MAFTFKVKTVTNRDLEISTLDGASTVLQVKQQIEQSEGVPPAQQRLIFNGRPLMDDNTLASSGVTAGTTLHMVLALRAGGGAHQ